MTAHRTYRTLSEIRAIRDRSNQTLRFPRTQQEAGMVPGPIEGERHPSAGGFVAMLAAAAVGAIVIYALVYALFLVETPEPAREHVQAAERHLRALEQMRSEP